MQKNVKFKAVLQDTIARIFAPLTLFIWGAGWVAGSIAGPFGTLVEMDLPLRAAFWFFIATSSVFLGYSARAVALLTLGSQRPVLSDILATVAITVTLGPLIFAVGSYVEAAAGAPVPSLPLIMLYVLIVSAPIYILRRLAPGFEAYGYCFMGDMPVLKEEPRLMRRLPDALRGEVVRLSAQGHFTEVVTTRGTHVLRLRMADAIEETDPIDGLSTHRSHWVALSAIQSVERENAHRMFVVLANEDRVPVSRSYKPDLEARGLLG